MDVPRTAPGVPFFSQPDVQTSLERILYIWGLRWVLTTEGVRGIVPLASRSLSSKTRTHLSKQKHVLRCRHPASGYVQGINDLVTPFLAVFMSEYLEGPMNDWAVGTLPPDQARHCMFWLKGNRREGREPTPKLHFLGVSPADGGFAG